MSQPTPTEELRLDEGGDIDLDGLFIDLESGLDTAATGGDDQGLATGRQRETFHVVCGDNDVEVSVFQFSGNHSFGPLLREEKQVSLTVKWCLYAARFTPARLLCPADRRDRRIFRAVPLSTDPSNSETFSGVLATLPLLPTLTPVDVLMMFMFGPLWLWGGNWSVGGVRGRGFPLPHSPIT